MCTVSRDAAGVHPADDTDEHATHPGADAEPWLRQRRSDEERIVPTVREPHGPYCQCRSCDPDTYFDMVRELRGHR